MTMIILPGVTCGDEILHIEARAPLVQTKIAAATKRRRDG